MPDLRETAVHNILENGVLSQGEGILLRLFYLNYPTETLRIALKWIQPDTYYPCSEANNPPSRRRSQTWLESGMASFSQPSLAQYSLCPDLS